MSVRMAGLLMVFFLYALLLAACFAIVMLLPASFLGAPAKAVLSWLPPFLRGEALRNWAAKPRPSSSPRSVSPANVAPKRLPGLRRKWKLEPCRRCCQRRGLQSWNA